MTVNRSPGLLPVVVERSTEAEGRAEGLRRALVRVVVYGWAESRAAVLEAVRVERRAAGMVAVV